MFLRSTTQRQPAQVLVLFALSLVALCAVAGLAVDGSIAYWQRARMQNAADAATSAASWKLADNWDGSTFCRKSPCLTVDNVQTAADSMARANGLDAAQPSQLEFLDANQARLVPQPTSSLPATVRGVRALAVQPFNTTFARVVGVQQLTASGQATGLWGAPSGLSVFPVAIGSDSSTLPNNVTFRFQPPQSGGNCSSTCVNFEMLGILPTYPAPPAPLFVNVGSSYQSIGAPSEDGRTVSTSLRNYVTAMVAADTSGSTCASYTVPNPRIVYVPYVNPSFNGPPENLTILGFRAFMFTVAYSDRLEGCWVNVNAAGGTLSSGGAYTGVTLTKLVPTP